MAVAPEAGSLEALRARLLATQSALTAKETAERVNEALTFAVGDLVCADIPPSLIQEIGQNEYQAQLFRLQAQVRLSSHSRTVASQAFEREQLFIARY